MSKKNNKQKSKAYHQFVAEQEKERARRSQLKQEKKKVKSLTNQITATLSNIQIDGQSTSNIASEMPDVNMNIGKRSRPKKAKRTKRRHRGLYDR
jgi:hypothetical protein